MQWLIDIVAARVLELMHTSRLVVYKLNSQMVTRLTVTPVHFDTVVEDTLGEWDTVNEYWKATQAGLYLVVVYIAWGTIADEYYTQITMNRNGSRIARCKHTSSASGSASQFYTLSKIVPIEVGDEIQIMAYHNALGGESVMGGVANNGLGIFKLFQ